MADADVDGSPHPHAAAHVLLPADAPARRARARLHRPAAAVLHRSWARRRSTSRTTRPRRRSWRSTRTTRRSSSASRAWARWTGEELGETTMDADHAHAAAGVGRAGRHRRRGLLDAHGRRRRVAASTSSRRTPRTCASSTSEDAPPRPRLHPRPQPDSERHHRMSDVQPPDDGDGEAAGTAFGGIEPIEIQEEMERSFLDYAMSVIVVARPARRPRRPEAGAPPHPLGHVRAAGLRPTARTMKCARVTGDVHGQVPPPRRPARSTTRWCAWPRTSRLRHPLIDPHGQLRLASTSPPAAARYTECRLAPLAMRHAGRHRRGHRRLHRQLSTARSRSPTVLPARFPNLLVNGSQGIAVGMATNIPPHNLGEVIDATMPPDRQPRRHPRRPHGSSSRAPTSRPARSIMGRQRDHGRLPHRPRLDQAAGQGRDRGRRHGRRPHRRHRAARTRTSVEVIGRRSRSSSTTASSRASRDAQRRVGQGQDPPGASSSSATRRRSSS